MQHATFAIQIAKHFGAEVATAASPRGDALVRRLGADIVIDYTRKAGLNYRYTSLRLPIVTTVTISSPDTTV